LNYNTWFPYRFGLPKDDALTFSWEPFQPKEYPQLWMEEGFGVCESYQSVGLGDLQGYADKCKPAYDKALQNGFSFRTVDASRLESHEIPALYKISMEGFRDNFLFEPLDPQGFAGIYVPAMKKADLSYSFFALNKEGKEVGFFYGFEDQGYLVLKTVAVLNEARGQGLSNALTYLQAKAALNKGHSKLITALVKTGAQSESYKKKATALWTHDYVLLKKEL
ncbi:MAG TPA: GNAT family N-acetyltransferase, partial [Pseudobdellovibrionaceae bacterium]|nr:GNAT family N-acetyltransferase [Pseudobdellovibrionaceae bacterium]